MVILKGSGTSIDPNLIENENDFLFVISNPSSFVSKYLLQVNDLNLEGVNTSDFTYVSCIGYNGNGKTIRNINHTLKSSSTDGFIRATSYVKNLKIKDSKISVSNSLGGASFVYSPIIYNIRIKDSEVSGNAGGASCFHTNTTTTVSFCSADNVKIYGQYAGGFFSNVTDSITIRDSYFNGEVRNDGRKVGGFVGQTTDTLTIERCYVSGRLYGTNNVGGFLGYKSSTKTVTINNSYSLLEYISRTSGTSTDFGVFIGLNTSSDVNISNSYYLEDIYLAEGEE